MPEEKKRFPWWLGACAVLLVLFAAVVGLIETVGRRGTLEGRWERMRVYEGMSIEEIRAVLGAPQARLSINREANACVWEDGPCKVGAWFDDHGAVLYSPPLTVENRPPIVWHVRRWAEKAYRAIHGPRR